MAEAGLKQPELLNIVTILEKVFDGTPFSAFLAKWEDLVFSVAVAVLFFLVAFFVYRNRVTIPSRLQGAVEVFVGGVDDFVCEILGPKGRQYTPFIGTLFIYILSMNLLGLVPFLKSSTASLSTTFGLAACVFCYVQFSALKSLGIIGYVDHLMERPRGILAYSVVIPILMFFLSIISELVRPLSLALRLRSNIWGDDLLLTILSTFGIKGVPLLLFNNVLSLVAAVVQAMVFCLLTTIYFALVMVREE